MQAAAGASCDGNRGCTQSRRAPVANNVVGCTPRAGTSLKELAQIFSHLRLFDWIIENERTIIEARCGSVIETLCWSIA